MFPMCTIVKLIDDDGSSSPLFESIDGGEESYCLFSRLKPYDDSTPLAEIKKETLDNLKVGDKVEIISSVGTIENGEIWEVTNLDKGMNGYTRTSDG